MRSARAGGGEALTHSEWPSSPPPMVYLQSPAPPPRQSVVNARRLGGCALGRVGSGVATAETGIASPGRYGIASRREREEGTDRACSTA